MHIPLTGDIALLPEPLVIYLTSSFLEIIELPNGDIVLKRADGDGEPLVSIRFSDESKHYMPDSKLEIARVMIQAGIEAAAEINAEENALSIEELEPDEEIPEHRILH